MVLPFVPFEGLRMYEESDNHGISFSLVSNDFQATRFVYNIRNAEFDIEIQEKWRNKVTNETIDRLLADCAALGWDRVDNNDVEAFKRLHCEG